jgi:predicted 2-oxoglutarate/Fe(II)-dependent dioxygenase YbiX
MPRWPFFDRFGLFLAPGFFDAETCRRLRCEARTAVGAPATVRDKTNAFVVNEDVRRVKWLDVDEALVSLVRSRLLGLKPALASRFGVDLTGCQTPQFLVYRPGDFYLAHADNAGDPAAPDNIRARKVSTVVFLNGQAEETGADGYGGGALAFCGLLRDPRATTRGIPLVGEAGLLVAFRSDVVHGVLPVTCGERYTIATWFV